MTDCPALSDFRQDTVFITKDNLFELVTSTDEVSPGTTVDLSCQSGLELVGESSVTCRNDGSWSYNVKPYCREPDSGGTSGTGNELSDDSKIMIGVVAGLAGIIIIALVLMICYVWYRDRQRKRMNRDFMHGYDRRGYEGPAVVEMYGSRLPRSSSYDAMSDKYSRSRYTDEDRKTRLSAPVYLPHQNEYRDYLEDRKRKGNYRKRSFDDRYSDRSKRPYVKEWISRNSTVDDSVDYSERALVHGYGRPRRDPYLWRNA